MLTFAALTNYVQNEWNILGSFMAPLLPQDHPGAYQRNDEFLFSGFEEFPARPHNKEAYGAFIVERRPEGAFATSIIPLIFISWIGVFGTLIPKDSGEKLRYSIRFSSRSDSRSR